MKKSRTVSQTGRVRPFGRKGRAGLAALCAGLLIVTGNWSMAATAAEVEVTDSSDTSESDDAADGTRGIAVSTADIDSITQDDNAGGENSSDGLYVSKYLTDNEDGTLQVTLESYVTGESTKIAADTPADILLILDASDSMKYSIYEDEDDGEDEDSEDTSAADTRLAAMQAGVISFIETIQEQNTGLSEEDQSRIAIMGFNSVVFYPQKAFAAVDQDSKASKAETLINIVNNWSAYLSGGTYTGEVLSAAQTIMEDQAATYGDEEERQQVIIFFTDGWPTDSTLEQLPGYSVTEAASALTAAASLKQSGVEIYCVCVSSGINTVDGEALPSYTKEGTEGSYLALDPHHYLSPEMNEALGFYRCEKLEDESDESYESALADYNKYVNTSDENARNLQIRFLYLLSSDNPEADDIDDDGVTTGGYFYTAHDTAALTEVFETLADMVGAADVSLGTVTELRDFLTEEFTLAGDVTLYTADYNGDGTGETGSGTWKDPQEISDPSGEGYTISATSGSVTVSGFDYAANYVSESPHTDTETDYYGCKLIVSFPITVSGDTFGGNGLPTNTEESGIYLNSSSGDPELTFPVPYADVELLYEMGTADAEEFVPDTAALSDLLLYVEGSVPDGSNNAYVTIVYSMLDEDGNLVGTLTIPAGTSAEECSWVWDTQYTDGTASMCGEYTIVCEVSPVLTGTYESITDTGEATVHIYYPEMTFGDTVINFGESIDLSLGDLLDPEDLGEHMISALWICEDGNTKDLSEGPELGYRTAITEGVELRDEEYIIVSGEDIPIVIGIFRISDDAFADDISVYTVFHHTCDRAGCAYSDEWDSDLGIRCLIHVRTQTQEGISYDPGTEDPDPDTGSDTDPDTNTDADDSSDSADTQEETGDSASEEPDETIYVTETTNNILTVSAAEETADDGSGTTLDRDVPQTGDEDEIILWLMCAGVAVIGLSVCVMTIWKRRSKRYFRVRR